jgi:hypothetical protein
MSLTLLPAWFGWTQSCAQIPFFKKREIRETVLRPAQNMVVYDRD